jgi:predicted GIY-YIG superfamily endonuclease
MGQQSAKVFLADNKDPIKNEEEPSYHNNVTWLYVLRLHDDNYYVGTTTNLGQRFEAHWHGQGSEWTKKHLPIEAINVYRDKTKFDEDAKTKELMAQYGISKVRGGSYCSIELSKQQMELLEHELRHGKNECLKCGSGGHYAKDCPQNICYICQEGGHYAKNCPKNNENGCARCGRNNHLVTNCYAKKHLDGTLL